MNKDIIHQERQKIESRLQDLDQPPSHTEIKPQPQTFFFDQLPQAPDLVTNQKTESSTPDKKEEKIEEKIIEIENLEEKEGKYSVQLLYWPAMSKKSTGHIALKIVKVGEVLEEEEEAASEDQGLISKNGIYISYWPKEKAGIFNAVPGEFHSEEKDKDVYLNYYQKEVKPIGLEISDLDLNINHMIDEFKRFKHSENNKKWALLSECIALIPCKRKDYSSHCSALTMSFLLKGNIKQYIPIYDQFGSFRHFLLLSASRVFVGTSLLAFGLYPLIEDPKEEMENPDKSFIGAIIITLINGLIVFLFERDSDPRQLIEMSYSDCAVGISASIGFGFFPLAHRRWVTPLLYQHNFPLWKKILVDCTMIPGSAVGLYLGGKLASGLVYAFGGTGYINHPSSVWKWVQYAKKMKIVDETVKNTIFRKELCFMTITIITGITCYAVRKLGSSRENSVYFGIPIGIGLNYILTFPCVNKLSNNLTRYLENKPEEDKQAIQVAIKSHDRSLEKYSIICLTTSLGIMGIISLYDRIKIFDPILESFMSFPGSILGFLFGLIFYKFCHCCRDASVQLYRSPFNCFSESKKINAVAPADPQPAQIEKKTATHLKQNNEVVTSPGSPPYRAFEDNESGTSEERRNFTT